MAEHTQRKMFARAFAALAPRTRVRTIDWLQENAFTDTGRAYDHAAYPWFGAPGGPCDALDDPAVRQIWLQFGIRMGKTQFGQFATLKYAATDPCAMLFASATERLALDITARTYDMIAKCPPLRDQLRPEWRRKQGRIDLDYCHVYLAWSKSDATLADKDIFFGHANEISKWVHTTTATEGTPLTRFLSRASNHPTHKYILESTPAVSGRCSVERGRLNSTNCSLYVPCPHCKKYQVLRMGGDDKAGGIIWDKTEDHSNAEVARKTATYLCAHCGKHIEDYHRAPMVRLGVWVPDGCKVIHKKAEYAAKTWLDHVEPKSASAIPTPWDGWENASWIRGKPAIDGPYAGYKASRLYDLSIGWGTLAAQFIDAKGKPQELRGYVNEWLADTWEHVTRKETWEQVGQRLICEDVAKGVVPVGYSHVTIGIDKQGIEDDNFYVYSVWAWGEGQQGRIIQYGILAGKDENDKTFGLAELRELLLKSWPHADGGDPVRLSLALIDSGYRPKGVGRFCVQCGHEGIPILPCKGASTALGASWKPSAQGQKTKMYGQMLIFVDAAETQDWIDTALFLLTPDDIGGVGVYHDGLNNHQDLLEQLLNDGPADKLDKNNNPVTIWERINPTEPNDYRDTARYAFVAWLIALNNGAVPGRVATQTIPNVLANPYSQRPDGRAY